MVTRLITLPTSDVRHPIYVTGGQAEVTTGLILPLPKHFDLALGHHILSEQFQLVHLDPRDHLERNKFNDILCYIVCRDSQTCCRLSHSTVHCILTLASLTPGPLVTL